MLKSIISGGQYGTELGALLATISLPIESNGYAPKRYMTLNGPFRKLADFNLKECKEDDVNTYHINTMMNIDMSDGVLIFLHRNDINTKCALGYSHSKIWTDKWGSSGYKHIFPVKNIDIADPLKLANWVEENDIENLCVIGPNEQLVEGIQDKVKHFLLRSLV